MAPGPAAEDRGMQPNWNEDRARHWHWFAPPARPSAAEVRLYERAIRRGGFARWALLGCTPELRSLAGKLGHEIVCIDWNAGVFAILKSLVAGDVRESLRCGSWLEVELERPVDLVLADGSLNMLPGGQHEALLRRIAGFLRPRGTALLRVHLAAEPRFGSPAEVFAAARRRPGGEGVFTATRTDLDMLWLDPETLILDFETFHRRLSRLREAGVITPAEYEPYDRLLPWNRIQLHYTTRRRFEEIAGRYFAVVDCQAGGDYTGSDHHPVYTLEKK